MNRSEVIRILRTTKKKLAVSVNNDLLRIQFEDEIVWLQKCKEEVIRKLTFCVSFIFPTMDLLWNTADKYVQRSKWATEGRQLTRRWSAVARRDMRNSWPELKLGFVALFALVFLLWKKVVCFLMKNYSLPAQIGERRTELFIDFKDSKFCCCICWGILPSCSSMFSSFSTLLKYLDILLWAVLRQKRPQKRVNAWNRVA